MAEYRTRSRTVRAVQWTGSNTDEVVAFLHPRERLVAQHRNDLLVEAGSHWYIVLWKMNYLARTASGLLEKISQFEFEDMYEPSGGE